MTAGERGGSQSQNVSPLRLPLSQSRLVVLTHYLPPYMQRVLEHVAESVPQTQVLLSIPLEPNRNFAVDWGSLNVQVQKSLMMRGAWRHRVGFKDELFIHIPYDTYRQLRRRQPDLILSYELGFRSLISAIYRRTHPSCRLALCVCVSEHTESGRGGSRWLLRRALAKMADAVTYNGPSCRRYLTGLDVPDNRLFHFPYAADDRTTPPSASNVTLVTSQRGNFNEVNRRLLIVGQLNARKGIHPFFDALESYCRQNPDVSWDLTLIGAGPLEESLRSRPLPPNLCCQITGSRPPEQLASEWSDYGVLVFPTLADEWGLVVNEAMRAGLPVIGSCYAQASTTLIQEDRNGWIYSPDHPEQLHAKLDALRRLSPNEMWAMRDRARSSVAHITSQSAAHLACDMFRAMLR